VGRWKIRRILVGKLSQNFTTDELSVTSTGLYNTPGELELEKLLYLANYILQPIRSRFGKIKINSAYRSKAVNEHPRVKGSPNSQHLKGEAADIEPLESKLEDVFEWARKNLVYGQIILEHKGNDHWVHISLPRIGGLNMVQMVYENGLYRNL
jgi:zinc D-Ala-D-Ala carboxypeptidase